jgi:hypothetical protein
MDDADYGCEQSTNVRAENIRGSNFCWLTMTDC